MPFVTARRILLIDNEKSIREVAQLCLETIAGWDVLTAESSTEAIALAEAEKVDAILVDLDAYPEGITSDLAPEQSLLRIFQQLQNHTATQQIPVILLTAIAPTKDLTQVAELGVTAVLAKPFDLLTLASQVSAALNWK